MIRHFGTAAYAEVMTWPRRLILRAVEIERERLAGQREDALLDASIGDGMELGRRYVDPENPPKSGGAHYDLAAFNAHMDALGRAARPWEHTEQAARRRRELLEDQMFDAFRAAVGGARA